MEIKRFRSEFGLGRLVILGDRRMVTQAHIDGLRQLGGVGWITALRGASTRKLVTRGRPQHGRSDEADLFKVPFPDDPGKRLDGCRNACPAPRFTKSRASFLPQREQNRKNQIRFLRAGVFQVPQAETTMAIPRLEPTPLA